MGRKVVLGTEKEKFCGEVGSAGVSGKRND